tara:strand:+ start:718 stop:882 length:165 start_codon:yes stop_codon:yes gene_type:complete
MFSFRKVDEYKNYRWVIIDSNYCHHYQYKKSLGQQKGSLKVEADFVCTKDFILI